MSSVTRTALLSAVLVLTLGTLPTAFAAYEQCSDGLDNDGDARIDYPVDPDCVSIDDNTEALDNGVFVTLTDNRDEVAPGEATIYVITLRQQREPMKLIDVAFHIPHQSSIAYASDDGFTTEDSVVWMKVAVFNTGPRRLTVHVVTDANAKGGQLMVARVVAENSVATDTTLVNTTGNIPYVQNQLEVTVNDGRDHALAGETLSYIVNVRNPETRSIVLPVRVKVPSVLALVDATGGASRIGDELTWKGVTIAPNQIVTFTFRAVIDPRAPKSYPIQVVARAGNIVGVDRTIVGSATGPTSLFSSITDYRENAARGELLTYTLHIDNIGGRLQTDANVSAGPPRHAEFVAATEGGRWDGTDVRWNHLQVAPGGSRDLQFTIRVRSDAPDGSLLRATAYVEGYLTSDNTIVYGSQQAELPAPYARNNAYRGYSAKGTSRVVVGMQNRPVQYRYAAPDETDVSSLQVTTNASAGEVAPGSTVDYTVSVRNNSTREIRRIDVETRFTPSQVSIIDAPGARKTSRSLSWVIDALQPGAVKTFTFNARIARSLRSGESVEVSSQVNAVESSSIGNTDSTMYGGGSDEYLYGDDPYAYDDAYGYGVYPETGVREDFVAAVENVSQMLRPSTNGASSLGGLVILGIVAAAGLLGGLLARAVITHRRLP